MYTVELDYSNDDDAVHASQGEDAARPAVEASVRRWLDDADFTDVTFDVTRVFGPAGGAAVVDFHVGDLARLRAFVAYYDAGNGDVDYLLEGARITA